jgi:hypothetical protein
LNRLRYGQSELRKQVPYIFFAKRDRYLQSLKRRSIAAVHIMDKILGTRTGSDKTPNFLGHKKEGAEACATSLKDARYLRQVVLRFTGKHMSEYWEADRRRIGTDGEADRDRRKYPRSKCAHREAILRH